MMHSTPPSSGAPLTLTLGDRVFAVATSVFQVSLSINDPRAGCILEIDAEGRDIEGTEWEPILRDHDLIPWPGLDRLPGFTLKGLGSSNASELHEPAFMLYQWDHLPVWDVTICFGNFVSRGIEFYLAGVVDPLDDSSPEMTPVSVEGALHFDGVTVSDAVGTLSPSAAEARLARDFDPGRFEPPKASGEHHWFFRYAGPERVPLRSFDRSADELGVGLLLWRPGDVILDLYEVLEVVEGGGMGLVYRVRHRGWGMDLAVKAPRPELVSSAAQLRDFEAEAETWVNLGLHPHTVSCTYVRRLGGVPRVFAEWVDGGSLADWVRDRRLYEGGPRAALERIVDVAIQFAWGLDHAHAQGLIHQDVKPTNVMLTRDAIVKVTDFGLARARAAAGERVPPDISPSVSCRGMTPAYCSPEQAAGVRLTRATDVWSWALSILELFNGHRPCDFGQAAGDALATFLDSGRPDPQIPTMPDDLATLLGRCFAAEPADRPTTMSDIADVLIEAHERAFDSPYTRPRPEVAGLLADGLSNQALSMLDLGHTGPAQQLWEQALHADGHHVHTIYNRGLDRWRRAEITDEQLVSQVETARVANADDWTASYLLGRIHVERGEYEVALDVLGEVAHLAPADKEVENAIGLARRGAAAGGSTTRLLSHDAPVSAATLTADGRLALTACSDGSMRVWDLRKGRVLRALRGHDCEVWSLAVSADGQRAVSTDADGILRVWDGRTGSCTRTWTQMGTRSWERSIPEHSLVALSADGRVAVSASSGGGTLRVWELPAGHCARTITFDAGFHGIRSLAMSADGLWALSGNRDGTLRVWDLATGQCLRAIAAGHELWSVALSVDGLQALSADDDRGTARLWDLRSGRCLRTLAGHMRSVGSVALSGRRALTRGDGGIARMWDLDSGRCLRTFGGLTGVRRKGSDDFALSADGRVALSAGADRTVRVWDPRSGRRSPWSYARPRAVTELIHEASAVREGLQRATRLIDGCEPAAAISVLRRVRSIAGYDRNGELLDRWKQAGRQGRRSSLRDAWHLHDLAHDTRVWPVVALSADGRLALTGGGEGVRIHALQTGRLLQTLKGHEGVASLAVSPDGAIVASASGLAESTVRAWDVRTGRCLPTLGESGGRSPALAAVSSEGRTGLTRHEPIGLRDIETGSMLVVLEGHTERIDAGALSADGRLGLSVGSGATIRVWDLQFGHSLGGLKSREGVQSVALSSEGRFAVSGGSAGTIEVWDLETARCLRALTGHDQSVNSLALSADSHLLISGSVGGTVRVWKLDWEYEFPEPADWDERARPYLETFLKSHAMLRPGSPLAQEDHDRLTVMLERVGFGWLHRRTVGAELGRIWVEQNA